MQSPLESAVAALHQGDVVAMPTETVYGLAARIDSPPGIQKIFSVKQRPFFDPLIVHVSSKQMASSLTTDWSPLVNFLAEHFWPGPLTMVLPKAPQVDDRITSGLMTVGIRMPRHSLALSLIDKVGVPLAAPSANQFGRTSPTTAEHVRNEFPQLPLLVLDGGPCEVGLESTVLHVRREGEHYHLALLRSGAVTRGELEKTLQNQKFSYSFHQAQDKKESPGQMKHHYMPRIPLVLVGSNQMPEREILVRAQAQLNLIPDVVDGVRIQKPSRLNQAAELNLPLDAAQASRLLYSEMRRLAERPEIDLLYFRIQGAQQDPSWEALMDRLTKAASLILNQ